MSSYSPPDQILTVFNVSDFDGSTATLTLAEANLLYAKLSSSNTFFSTNNFANIVSIYNSPLYFYNLSVLTASISTAGVINGTDFQINGVEFSAIFAPINSPNFTGIPCAPTAPASTNTLQIANTAFVTNAINALIGGAPYFLDTLNEIAGAIADDPTFSATVFALIATKQNKLSATNLLNVAYIGNGDCTNNILSYLKNVSYDINGAIVALNTATTGISYANAQTNIANNVMINRKSLLLSDISNTTSNYSSIYYSATNNYITNYAGSNNSLANTIFQFATISPSSYVNSVSINYLGLSTIALNCSGSISANGGLTVPINEVLSLSGSLSVNSVSILPNNLSQLYGLNLNVQNTLTSNLSSINAIDQIITNISYNNIQTTTCISAYTALANATINNNLSVGGSVVIGSDIILSGNIIISGQIITPNQTITYNVGNLLINSMSLPIIKSIANTKIAFGSLNLQMLMGTSGNCSVIIYPQYKIQFISCGNVLYTCDNTYGIDMLFAAVTFNNVFLCTSIITYFKNIQI